MPAALGDAEQGDRRCALGDPVGDSGGRSPHGTLSPPFACRRRRALRVTSCGSDSPCVPRSMPTRWPLVVVRTTTASDSPSAMPGFGTQTGSRKSPSPLMSSLALSGRQVAHGAVANFRRRKAHPHVDGRAGSAYLTATPRASLGNEVSAIGSLGEIPLVSQRSRWGIV